MGIIMVTIYYPTHKATEIAKLYLKQPRDLPPHVTKWRAFNTSAGKDGMKQYHIIYTERGKAEEAWLEVFKYFMPFSSIEGYNIQVESVMGVTDSFKLMGMQW